MLEPDSEYVELPEMHSPKKMLQIIGKKSEYGALPLLEKRGLRDCQYKAETKLEESLKLFQEGAKLVEKCTKQLDEAELQIKKIVTDANGEPVEENFNIEL